MEYLFFVLVAYAAFGTGSAKAADLLTIGSPAPALNIESWVKGEPVSGIEKGQVYVIEFWGTRCAPCIRGMPHLSELQRQYPAVKFVSVAGEPEQTIRSFVAKNDKNMGFRVGWDGTGRMWKSWMESAGLNGIPAAFLVDNSAKIVWIGDPDEMDEPLRAVLQGKYDPSANIIALRFERARIKASEKDDERLERGNRLVVQVETLIGQQKSAEAVALVEKAIQNEPGERVRYGELKLRALVADPKLADQALAYGIELAAAVAAGAEENHRPTHQSLLSIAQKLVAPSGDGPPNPGCCDLATDIVKWAGTVARQDNALHEQDQIEQRLRFDSLLGEACAGKGEFNRAVQYTQRALQFCRSAAPPPNVNKEQFQQNMANWAKSLEAELAAFQKKATATPGSESTRRAAWPRHAPERTAATRQKR